MKQKYISKAEILSLKKMMRKLAKSDESYKQLYNRITTISNSNRVIGKNDASILTEFYERFQKEITENKKTTCPEQVWTKEDYKGIPKGSCINVEKNTTNTYEGTWSFMGGTRPISIPKHLCSETSNLENIKKSMSVYFETQK